MMRSIIILSSYTATVAMGSNSIDVNAQQLWYPDFAADYESGSCTTSPSEALLNFASGSINPDVSMLAQKDKGSCCETWFPDQEFCGCLGGGCTENDAASALVSPVVAAHEEEEQNYWYPKFGTIYEEGLCVKFGVNTDGVPPSYYTKEGGFLQSTMDGCCEHWFGEQRGSKCLTALGSMPSSTKSSMMNENITRTISAVADQQDAFVDCEFEAGLSAVAFEKSH
mmetsp:Transcript_18571/g.39046  ORF Transcript_18571/g.39046 Transcript_18571/m.39046 type:complete len:225 (+) Transcript_18571:121-795(+)